MQISDSVFLVGSGKYGHQISNQMDCNVFLLDGGNQYAMIDAGSGVEPERIVANIERAGIAMSAVTHLLLTHLHGDHAAGAYYFQSRYGLEVICAAEAAPWLEQANMEKTSLDAAKAAGVYPSDFRFPACPVARSVAEGDIVTLGDAELKVIETPGHCRGHLGFLLERNGQSALFSGDTIFAGGKVVIQRIWDCCIQEYADTMARLKLLGLRSLYPGHGPFLLTDAYTHIERAHEFFERLEVPPNL